MPLLSLLSHWNLMPPIGPTGIGRHPTAGETGKSPTHVTSNCTRTLNQHNHAGEPAHSPTGHIQDARSLFLTVLAEPRFMLRSLVPHQTTCAGKKKGKNIRKLGSAPPDVDVNGDTQWHQVIQNTMKYNQTQHCAGFHVGV